MTNSAGRMGLRSAREIQKERHLEKCLEQPKWWVPTKDDCWVELTVKARRWALCSALHSADPKPER
jgi:hypothetical protein